MTVPTSTRVSPDANGWPQGRGHEFVLVAAAMAQTIPVLTGGLDLSVGGVITLVNCVASHVLAGGALTNFLGIVLCLAVGMAAGLLNGCLVVYGRLQPIIATLASGTIFVGIALFLRPTPGGQVDGDLAFAATFDVNELLQAAGMTFDNVVSARVFLPDLSTFQQMNATYRPYFKSAPPARATANALSFATTMPTT